MIQHVNPRAAGKPAPQPKPEEKVRDTKLRLEPLEERLAPLENPGRF